MEMQSIGALRQYNLTKTALKPEGGMGKTATPDPEKPSMVDGVKDFSKVFENVEQTTQAMAMGQADAHSVVQAMATAEVALETAVTIRNRVVEAYQELLRMPI